MMDRYLLRYFLAIVETGNFSRAAARENVAQPTLSAGIAKLEAQLQARLFDRTNRRVHLTEAGSRLLVHARRIEHEFNLAQAAVSGVATAELVRVAVLSTIPAALIEEILARRPTGAERLELLEGSEREVISLLDRGRVEVALTTINPSTDRFGAERLHEEGYGLALPAGHRLAGAEMLDGEALADEVMMVRRHCEVLAQTSRYFTDRGVRPFFSYRGASDEKVLALVRAGLGITVMPDSYRDPGVARVGLRGFTPRRVLGICYAGDVARHRTSGFAQATREVFGEAN
ncbi:LysR family transcriptional regulator [Phenylobacterium sp. Root77]|nr:LysR family transcriptional regulator [Phenylobacterium sp. Root1277]KQW92795.1 LysR family transcriptional regulator [Phenylobacterium sp. Root1290]KRC41742.1 LysR family transcriptional regulator [Phenylobacterium sp. Root77]